MKLIDWITMAVAAAGTLAIVLLASGCSTSPVAYGLVGGMTNGCPASPRWEGLDVAKHGEAGLRAHLPFVDAEGVVSGYATAVCVGDEPPRQANPVCCEFPHIRAAFLEGR